LRAEFRGSAPDAGKIPGVLGMQNVLNGVSMAVGVMEKALYSPYTPLLLASKVQILMRKRIGGSGLSPRLNSQKKFRVYINPLPFTR
jgi:hypothetical protein